MSTTFVLNPAILQVNVLLEKVCSGLSSPNTISLQNSANENASVESHDFDARSLGSSESSGLCASTSPSLTFQTSPSTSFDTIGGNHVFQRKQTQRGQFSNVLEFLQEDYLRFLEPCPVGPPSYETLPPGGCPRFPIMDINLGSESLPSYSPSAYKLGVVYRKLEWLSPYEPSPVRSWKMFVIELNSTQLNFYSIPSRLESTLLAFENNQSDEPNAGQVNMDSIQKSFKSLVTSQKDLKFQQLCDDLDFLKNKDADDTDDDGYTSSASLLSSKTTRGDKNRRLLRSYSLQHARIGLASDYTKKSNVLRLRLENEQFLLNFSCAQDVIDWNMGLCVGRDVAMDLVQREVPRYRTVPRRRRTQVTGSTIFYHEAVARRNRAHSDTLFEVNSGLRSKFSKLRTKLSSLSLTHLKGINSQGQKSVQQQQMKQVRQFRQAVRASMPETFAPVGSMSSMSLQRELNRQGPGLPATGASFSIAGAEEDEDVQYNTLAPHLSQTENSYEEGDEDVHNLSDLHRSDDEEDFDVDADEFAELAYNGRSRRTTSINGGQIGRGDHKWNPLHKPESNRRFIRNCLKCIKPLTFDEPWVNKLLMKPCLITSLSQVYLKSQYNGLMTEDFSTTSLASMTGGSASDLSSLREYSSHLRKPPSLKESFLNPDVLLTKVSNHNLREFVVGCHSLIPTEL